MTTHFAYLAIDSMPAAPLSCTMFKEAMTLLLWYKARATIDLGPEIEK